MACPICSGSVDSDNFSVIEKKGRVVILQGKIVAIMNPKELNVPPFQDYFTVTLKPRRGGMKYLKFRTQDELERWSFIPDQRVRCEGCLHRVDEKDLVFDVQNVEYS